MLKNRFQVQVQWADCDPADIVFYPHYFRWMDSATHALFAAAGIDMMRMFEELDMAGLPILDAHANFRIASTVGDRLVVESWIEEWRSKTFLVKHRFLKGPDEALAAEGHELRVWGLRHPDDRKRLKAGEIPADFKARFG